MHGTSQNKYFPHFENEWTITFFLNDKNLIGQDYFSNS